MLMTNHIALLAGIIPGAFLSIFIFSRLYPGLRPKILINFTKIITSTNAFLAPILFLSVIIFGNSQSPVLGNSMFGFSLRLDALSGIMLSLISVLGFFVLRFSYNYLDGDKRQGYFIGAISITLMSVALLVLSGHIFQFVLAWIATSLSLHKLLVFYKERHKAIIAANKKFIVARLGDLSLILAAIFIGLYFQTGDLGEIFTQAKELLQVKNISYEIQLATVFLLIAAALKSAQFPTQAWLLELMETPTPVSALLHAGILNAGVFLLVRFSDLIVLCPSVMNTLMILGTITALFASSVMLVQAKVKTSLAYSSAAHMGFMMVQCGLGAFSLAILHLVAHSFYKAHAFLRAGDLKRPKEKFYLIKNNGNKSLGNWQTILISTLLSSIIVLLTSVALDVAIFKSSYNLALGIFFIAGISLMISPSLKKGFNFSLIKDILIASFATAFSFYALERLGDILFSDLLPHAQHHSIFSYIILSACALSFIVFAWAQIYLPEDSSNKFWNHIYVILKNSLHTNTYFSLITGELKSDENKTKKIETFNKLKFIKANSDNLKINFNPAINKAIHRISPIWPLKDFVAVNPYHQILDYKFTDAVTLMSEIAGSKTLMPSGFYRDLIENGTIEDEDIKAALKDEGLKNISLLDIKNSLNTEIERDHLNESLLLVKDHAEKLTGIKWSEIILERISLFCTNYFDGGQATWQYPWRNKSLYTAWREDACLDSFPELLGLKGFRSFVSSLPNKSDELINLVLEELGIDERLAERYCHRLLMSIAGWSSYCRYHLWNADLKGTQDDKLKDFLAISLVYELSLFQGLRQNSNQIEEIWEQSKKLFQKSLISGDISLNHRNKYIMQLAFEKSFQRKLFNQILDHKPTMVNDEHKKLQMVFCIDVRSEVFRRNLESLDSSIETLGFAGFFGFALDYKKLGEAESQLQCPVLLTPICNIKETIQCKSDAEINNIIIKNAIKETASNIWNRFKMSAVSCFAFVGPIGFAYLPKLFKDSFPKYKTKNINEGHIPSLEPEASGYGLTLSKKVLIAEQALKAMSLRSNFASFILITGHKGSTVNNPHEAGLDCGACGGHSGEPNARIAALILNDSDVRCMLIERGIEIPNETIFLAALHDTTTDLISIFDEELIPKNREIEFQKIKNQLNQASLLTMKERSKKLLIDKKDIKNEIYKRSIDWSQVRPEWALANNSIFIAAPRSSTAGLNLEGKAFLHNYDWKLDKDFSILNLIMTAPMIVASWISYQYYASVVDNKVFGSGNKTLHNITGLIGVLEGNGGDLKSGLALQSIHDGENYIHEPKRLTVIIEAPTDAINQIIHENELLKNLFDNKWLHLFALNKTTNHIEQYTGNLSWKTFITNLKNYSGILIQ